MIQITDKHNCCGCEACVQACPKECIRFEKDEKGFRYPLVDKDTCIDCGLCEKVCPMLNVKALRVESSLEQLGEVRNSKTQPKPLPTTLNHSQPLRVLAACNPNEEVRKQSSSGGVFTMLAEKVLSDGGVVFGARYNDSFEVEHSYIDGLEQFGAVRNSMEKNHSKLFQTIPNYSELLQPFRGAKYSQSRIGDSYKQAKEFLKQGRKVLFSGTGCQIAGLKLFLRKVYDNLLTVEIACHGVPSPKVWREYVKKVTDGKSVTGINFRDKRNGWNGYGLTIKNQEKEIFYERAFTNDYMQCFLLDLCNRPSCSNCPAKRGASGADILIGDFWGVESLHPEMHDDKGCSVVVAYSQKGVECLEQFGIVGNGGEQLQTTPNHSKPLQTLEIPYEEAYKYNPALVQSTHESRYAPIFWYNFKKYGIEAAPRTLKLIRSSKIKRMIALFWYRMVKKV